METIAYKVGSTWTEVSLTALGVSISATLELGTHGESKFTLPLASLPPEIAPAIPFEALCIIYTGRTGSGGSWTGGSILFQGRRTDNSGQVSGSSANQELVIEDAWYDLRFMTLQAAWSNITSFTGTTPNYGTPFTWPDCVLFQASPGGPLQVGGTFGTYSPAAVSSHITTGQSIKETLAYAIYFGGVNLQIGTIDPACYVPFYPVRSMRCADAIKMALRVHPDCTSEIDYTTTPPTFNIRLRSNLTGVTLPYKSTSGNQKHLTSRVRPRPDLQVSRVGIYIKQTSTVNGNSVVSVGTDIYPTSTPSGLRSFDVSVDMNGPKISSTSASLTSVAFDPTDLTWWPKKLPALKTVANGGQLPNSGTGALAQIDATINGGSGHLKGITVVDNTGAAINLTNYPYELLTGSVCNWMQLSGGGSVNVIEATVTAFFTYNKTTTLGSTSTNLTDKVTEHSHSVRVKLTNSPTATYTNQQTLNTGETYPTGLAQAIYTSLSTLQYNFTHTILESPFATMIKPGKHCLNLSGGASAWSTMNAMIQGVTMELMFNPASGITTAKTTVTCGPVEHLEDGELIQLTNIFNNRDLSKINPAERTGGQSMGGGSASLATDSPKENSTAAEPVYATQNLTGPDALDATRSITIQHDATTGQTAVAQVKTADGSNYTSGIIAPQWSGSGAPSASTLATNATYRLRDRYLDTTANAEYICITAGDKTSSGWAPLGGGGSVSLFAITALSNADTFTAVPITVSYVSGVLNLAFGTAVSVAKHNRLRPSVTSELIDGLTITYSAYTGDNTRTASDGTNTEYQVAFPRYTTMAALSFSGYLTTPPTGATALAFLASQCVVKCASFNTGAETGGTPIMFEELTPRVWARRYIQ